MSDKYIYSICTLGSVGSTTWRIVEESKVLSKFSDKESHGDLLLLSAMQREGSMADKSPGGFFRSQEPKLGGY